MRIRYVLLFIVAGLVAGVATASADERSQKAKAAYESGMAHFTLDEYDEAIKDFQDAFLAKPDPVFLYNIGQAARLGNHPELAIRYYEKYLKAADNPPNAQQVREHIAVLEKVVQQQAAAKSANPTGALPPESEQSRSKHEPSHVTAPATVNLNAPPPGPEPETPVYKKWWLWTAVGGVIVAGGVIAIAVAATTPKDASSPANTFGVSLR